MSLVGSIAYVSTSKPLAKEGSIFFNSDNEIIQSIWRETWENLEKNRFRHLARLFFITSAAAYVFHFFFIDMRLGKEPVEQWAAYRFGLAGFAALGFLLTLSDKFCKSSYYKAPMMVAGFLFSYMQVQTMTWVEGIPYFYAFIIPSLTAVVLRLNLLTSVLYLGAIHLSQIPGLVASGIESHLIASAMSVSFMTVIVFRANMVADVNAFMSEQMKDEMQIRLNAALNETRKKEKALAETNQELLRKNQIFKTLLESATNLPHFQDVRELLAYAAKEFESLFKGCGIFLVISDQGSQLLERPSASTSMPIPSNRSLTTTRSYLTKTTLQNSATNFLSKRRLSILVIR